jgi:hypothetical protein
MVRSSRGRALASTPLVAGAALFALVSACEDETATGATSSTSGTSGTSSVGTGGGQSSGTGGSSSTVAGSGGATTITTGATTTSGTGGGACETVALFDGNDDVIKVTVGSELDARDDFSVSARVRPENLDPDSVAFVAGRHLDGASNGYYLALTNDANGLGVRFNVFTGNATCSATAPLTLPASGWVHVAGSWKAPDVRLFVDGVLVKIEPCGNFTSFVEPTSYFSIGRSDTGALPFKGRLDDVRYGLGAFTSNFDPSALSCSAGGQLLIDFEGVSLTETDAVPETCSVVSADGVVGGGAGSDLSDPVFICDF